jgi:methylenetetrahydrofolate reductase (NADPH)
LGFLITAFNSEIVYLKTHQMTGLKPARRWQPPFYPFKKEKLSRWILAGTERMIKGPLFGCRMCGNCLLQETAFICPMECPKGMRNGPCGGITPEKMCYVDTSRKCIWNAIYEKAFRTGRQERLLEILPPLDWIKTGTETWGDVLRQIKKTGVINFVKGIASSDENKRTKNWDGVFKTIRQPEWWNGDPDYHPAHNLEPASNLEKRLRSGEFVFATEISPPVGSSITRLVRDLDQVKPYVTAINFTDSSSARPKMSSLACCSIAIKENAEPVLQIAARDTTRTGLQATATGVNAMGIKNLLCITGDNAIVGSSPTAAMNILDIDSVQMLWILRRMRDEGKYLDGRLMKNPPNYFLGASSSPFAMRPELQAMKDMKKINAGAQFIQTNLVFEPEKLDLWLEQLDKLNALKKVYILVGIAPLRNFKIAEYLRTKVPGIKIPDRIMTRLKNAGNCAEEEGVQIALEIIESVKCKTGVNGVHVMSLGWESIVGRLVTESGLQPNIL